MADTEKMVSAVDIVKYISQFTDLEQRGDEFWGLSPFTDEKTPSFSIRRETGQFYDFSAGFGGSVLTFVMRYYHCSLEAAADKLEKFVYPDGATHTQTEELAATSVCRKYKKRRQPKQSGGSKILDPNYMDRYTKDTEKLAVWENEGISAQVLERFGVRYDAFSNRLVYPIKNEDGEIVNIGGRTLNPQWKEKNIRKYTYFFSWGGGMNIVYGLYENMEYIKERKEVIIFEGAKSVMLAETYNIKNTAALLTCHCSPNQMKILAKLGCRVVFALDKGVVVHNDRNICGLKNYVNCEYLWDSDNLLEDKDSPIDKGAEIFKKLYTQRRRL